MDGWIVEGFGVQEDSVQGHLFFGEIEKKTTTYLKYNKYLLCLEDLRLNERTHRFNNTVCNADPFLLHALRS